MEFAAITYCGLRIADCGLRRYAGSDCRLRFVNPQSAIRNPQSAIFYRLFVRDDIDLTLFLVVLRELLLVELLKGLEVPLVLPRAPPTVLRAVFVALLTLRLRDSALLLGAFDDLFPPPLVRGLAVVALFLRMLADLAPL